MFKSLIDNGIWAYLTLALMLGIIVVILRSGKRES
jgi:hypothetical protein